MGEPLQERRRDPGGNRICDASGAPDSIGPVRAQERIVTLDILRGITAFVEGKAITTFSCLFGLGFALQMARAKKKASDFVPFFSRRMALLFLIGVPHGVLLWYGDILMSWVAVPPEAWEAMPWLPVVFEFVMVASMVFLAAGYIATATLLVHDHERWKRVLSIFAPVGRMALTNYIAQSVVCFLIFYGIGLGLMAQVGPAVALLISLAVFAVQILWSHWWLAHFRFGPLEWLWRMATYGKLQPMRIPTAVQPTATGP